MTEEDLKEIERRAEWVGSPDTGPMIRVLVAAVRELRVENAALKVEATRRIEVLTDLTVVTLRKDLAEARGHIQALTDTYFEDNEGSNKRPDADLEIFRVALNFLDPIP